MNAAADWIEANQLGRRNLTPDQRRVLIGHIYKRRKKTMAEAGAMKGKSLGQNDLSWTAEAVGKEHGVDPATVRRAGKLAEEVDADPALRDLT